MILLLDNPEQMRRFKIRIEGADKEGKNTTRLITVFASDLDEVTAAIRETLRELTAKWTTL